MSCGCILLQQTHLEYQSQFRIFDLRIRKQMSQLQILIVEDEMIVADHLMIVLEKLGYDPLRPAINYTEALETLKNNQVDLAFLDIHLAGSRDGIDLAWKIREDFDIPFIFLTSNTDSATVERAKLVNPAAFLVKPFGKADIYTSIEMAIHNYKPAPAPEKEESAPEILRDMLFVRHKDLFVKIKLKDIAYMKAARVYLEVYTSEGKKYLIRKSLTEITERFPDEFFRLHRSYTVNLDHLSAINSQYVVVGEEKIPIGKNYREELLSRIQIE